MPTITQLQITHFRNLSQIALNISPKFNIFYGENGSGKTSLLEAIYYLGLGRSFRANLSARIIQKHQESFTVVARLNSPEQQFLGLEKGIDGTRHLKLDGEKQNSIAAITKLLPIQFMSPMSYRFFHDGPKTRRQLLDWGLFHVEQTFLATWQRLQRVLKQRNSALKGNYDLTSWNEAFIIDAEQLDCQRSALFSQLQPLCLAQLQLLLPNYSFELRYKRGWPNETSLAELLQNNLYRDRQLGYTYYGPQRADFQLLCDKTPVQDVLSQGQQKLAAYALHLALGTLLQQQTGANPIYLIDDLPSELDKTSRSKIIESLGSLNAQTFITGISKEDLSPLCDSASSQLFHVEHGSIESALSAELTAK